MAKSQPNYLAPMTGRQSHSNKQPDSSYQPLGTSVKTPGTPSSPDTGSGFTQPTPQPLGQPVDQAAVMRQHLLNRQTAPAIDPNAYPSAGGYRVAQNVALHQQRHPNAAFGMMQQPQPTPVQQPGIPTTNVPTPGSPTPGGGIVPGQPTTNVPGGHPYNDLGGGYQQDPNDPNRLNYGGGNLPPWMYDRGINRGPTAQPYPGQGGMQYDANPAPDAYGNYGGPQYNPGPGYSYDSGGTLRQNGYNGTVGAPQQQQGAASGYPGYDRQAYDQQALANARRLFSIGGAGLAPNALEQLGPTEMALMQSAARKSGVDWNSWLRQYAASRMMQGNAQQA